MVPPWSYCFFLPRMHAAVTISQQRRPLCHDHHAWQEQPSSQPASSPLRAQGGRSQAPSGEDERQPGAHDHHAMNGEAIRINPVPFVPGNARDPARGLSHAAAAPGNSPEPLLLGSDDSSEETLAAATVGITVGKARALGWGVERSWRRRDQSGAGRLCR